MATIDVELDDFDTVDMMDEIVKRMRGGGFYNVTKGEWRKIRENFEWLAAQAGWWVKRIESIDDQAKVEILSTAITKYTSFQLEEKLK